MGNEGGASPAVEVEEVVVDDQLSVWITLLWTPHVLLGSSPTQRVGELYTRHIGKAPGSSVNRVDPLGQLGHRLQSPIGGCSTTLVAHG